MEDKGKGKDNERRYNCKDCAYFANGEVCRCDGEYRETTKENVACVNFECDKIIDFRITE